MHILFVRDDINLEIPVNSFTVAMGPSGSGKSTLLYLLGGLDRPTSGTMVVNDQRLDEMDENRLAVFRRETVGFIFQSFNLIQSMTAEENVGFPMQFAEITPKVRVERSLDLLNRVGLSDRGFHRPSELSGGQQQRVAIARALVNQPSIILADEPTGNLDSRSSHVIMEELSDLHKRGNTIIMVTHNPDLTTYASRVIHMLDGKIASDTKTPRILKKQSEKISLSSRRTATKKPKEEKEKTPAKKRKTHDEA